MTGLRADHYQVFEIYSRYEQQTNYVWNEDQWNVSNQNEQNLITIVNNPPKAVIHELHCKLCACWLEYSSMNQHGFSIFRMATPAWVRYKVMSEICIVWVLITMQLVFRSCSAPHHTTPMCPPSFHPPSNGSIIIPPTCLDQNSTFMPYSTQG